MMGADIVVAVFLDAETAHKPNNITDVIGRSFNIVVRHADFGWRAKADVIIEPHVRDFAWDDFVKTPEMVAAGRAGHAGGPAADHRRAAVECRGAAVAARAGRWRSSVRDPLASVGVSADALARIFAAALRLPQ